MVEDIEIEIAAKLSMLYDKFPIHINNLITSNLNLDGLDKLIDTYLEPEIDVDEHRSYGTGETYISDIEAIFER